MNKDTAILITIAVLVAVSFGLLWKRGYLARFSTYVQDTREELRKCNWPSWDELKGSTVVVLVVTGMIGLFTVFTDGLFTILFTWLNKAVNS
jgi:preprotein translocase subunit SecE